MKSRLMLSSSLLLSLVLASTASASSTWYVDGVNGNDSNDCQSATTACKTIGHAISLASKGDSIMVAAATYTENLTIGFNLKVIGSSAKTTIIDGNHGAVVFISRLHASVILSKVTIQNGGYGILNYGTLTINNSTISGNSATGNLGGGISNSGMLTINNSTISGNSANRGGGGIFSYGTLTINNSTISRNSATRLGGGILNAGGTLTINNSTISGNSATLLGSGGGIFNEDFALTIINNSTISGNSANRGIGIYNNVGSATLQNSIVANSSSGENCGGTITSNGYNLSSDGTCNFNNTGDLNAADPKLGPLQNNGGPTQTQALLPGSPAIDAGNPSGCTDGNGQLLKTDQRGEPRPDKEDNGIGCDMGAFERQSD